MNIHIEKRLRGIYNVLSSAFEAGDLLSSASKGYEREVFISLFLKEVLPPLYRFGTGDIIDALSNSDPSRRSGQIDIVVEMPWCPSFSMPGGGGARLYPAEAVGTAIEVKSDLVRQWDEVLNGAQKLALLRQQLGGVSVEGGGLTVHADTEEPVPLYAVGYEGWKTTSTVTKHLQSAPLDGVLILKHQIFAWTDRKEYLARVTRCKTELNNQRHNAEFNMTLAACARILELCQENILSVEIAEKMNSEDYSIRPVHFGDQHFLPKTNSKEWVAQSVEEVARVLSMKTNVVEGAAALFQFVNIVYREVSKRAAMTADLSRYIA